MHIRTLTADDVDPLAAALAEALMTGAERNLAFYRKHGYRELQRFNFPGASAWWMWRDPV